MTYRKLFLLTILIPTAIIGGFEYVRHECLLPVLSMETGNLVITLLTLLLSILYARWMVSTIQRMNEQLAEERARRAVYEERERLARELHDGIAQSLFFLNVMLKQGNLEEARAAVTSIDNQVRQAIFNLRTKPDECRSFAHRVDKWLSEWSMLTGVETSHQLSLPDDFPSPSEEVHLFGIIQEAFANIRKHANARHASLSLTATPGGDFELVIRDDGIGLGEVGNAAPRYGMAMMRERAEKLGAAFTVQTKAAGGTELRVTRRQGGDCQ